MRIRNQHPDAHASKSVGTWELAVTQNGSHWKYTNRQSDSRTFKPFRSVGLDGMRYLLRTSGYDCSGVFLSRLPDGSFVLTDTQLDNSDVWVNAGQSCVPVEFCIVTPADWQLMQIVGAGCFVAETATY